MEREVAALYNFQRLLSMSDCPVRTEMVDLLTSMHTAGVVTIHDTPITLKGGSESRVYVHGRNDITENPELLHALARLVNRRASVRIPRGKERIVFLGAQTAGTPLAIAAGLVGSDLRIPCCSRMMRTKPKQHGAHRTWVDGAYRQTDFYVTVDNVITDGATKMEVVSQLFESGYMMRPLYHLVLIDRQQGGIEAVRKAGHKIDALFDLLDIAEAFGTLELWSAEQVKMVREEISLLQASA